MRKIRTRTFTGTSDPKPQAYESRHRALARRAAAEGIILLKNEDSLLPISTQKKIALFGSGAVRTIKGGTGSGDVNERETVSVYKGLVNAGYQIVNKDWLLQCEAEYESVRIAWREEIMEKAGADSMQLFDAYSMNPFSIPAGPAAVKTDADTALFVLSRNAGEEKDRWNEKGDYYLTDDEERLVKDICLYYENVVLLLNTGGIVDLSFLDTYPQIKSVLYISQPGMEGGNAAADIISGKTAPSGKLTDTWAYRYKDYPNAESFSHNNGNTQKEYYEEGIYVGYRYFDSFHIPVRYEFGYGLSYTDFQIEVPSIQIMDSDCGKEICVTVTVTNTGNIYSGREVVQAYISLPDGKLEKEFRRLCGFIKTNELAPGEKQTAEIRIPIEYLTSYDEEHSEWFLDKGYYGIWVGSSLDGSKISGMIEVEEYTVWSQASAVCPLKESLSELSLSKEIRSSRYDRWIKEAREKELPVVKLCMADHKAETNTYPDIPGEFKEAKELASGLSVDQMIRLVTGRKSTGSSNNLGASGMSVPGSAGETSACAEENGVASIVMADGPAGLRITQTYYVKNGEIIPTSFEQTFEHGFFATSQKPEGTAYYQYCTAFPVGTLLAQTWNLGFIQSIGAAVAEEMKYLGVDLWLAPGMNIHRNPLCGRNFEYYSEDPFLSGKAAAAITTGVQNVSGCGTTIKHFACNNQEDNRMHSDSILSERVLREIYLKGFEIAVKESQPRAIMSSYNLVNGIHAANHHDLCTQIIRNEWGFEGLIMTDWTTTEQGEDCTASGCMKAGNDLVMPGQQSDRDNIKASLENGTLTEEELKKCVIRIIRVILKSGQYEGV